MLCPVLLCAALLLLTPLEITEARALHPSPDAVQVQEEIGVDVEGWIKKKKKKIDWGEFRVNQGESTKDGRQNRKE